MTYKEQLLDPRWQKKRLLILERDNWTCQYCYDKESTLMVHHLFYEKQFAWEAEDDTLITLCDKCHNEYHELFSKYEKILLKNFRKKLRDPFIAKCAAELFQDVYNLNDLIYSLWELKNNENIVLDRLREITLDLERIYAINKK